MGMHHELAIYQTGYELLSVAIDVIRTMPIDCKQALGGPMRDECIQAMLQVRKANMAADKEQDLLLLLERLEVVEIYARTSRDKKIIANGHYAQIIERTQSMGKQANAWRKDPSARSFSGSQGDRNHALF